jgi:putative peptidoglycan lipid II flippase
MGPRLLGVAVVQLNFWINVRLASMQPDGSVTAIQIAFTLMLMPQAAIAQSIATAALPTFATQVAQNKLSEMRNSLAASMRGILLLSVPASLGLILFREPIITLLYQRGQFTTLSTQLVAWALLWYAAGLVGHAMVEILARSFYALHDTRTPVLIGIAAMSLNVAFSYLFSFLFQRWGWMPHGGLALANSLATALEMVGLVLIMRKRLGGLGGSQIGSGLMKAVLAGTLMSSAIWIWFNTGWNLSGWIFTLGGIFLAIAVYGIGLVLLRTQEAHQLAALLRRKIKKN